MSTPRIIVVGAGLSGLAAACCLRARGAGVIVLERGERAGGRASSDERDGWCFDAGAQVFGSADRAFLRFVEASGLGGEALPIRPLDLAQMGAGGASLIEARGWRGVARIPGVRLLDGLRVLRIERILSRFRDILDPAAPERGARLDDRSLADFARLYFGSSALEHWAGPLAAEHGGARAEQASRLLFLLLLGQHRWATPATLRVGLGRVAEAAAEGLDLRVGAAVETVEPAAGSRLRVHLASGEVLEADAVVVATRAGAARRLAAPLLTPAESALLGAARYASSVVLHVALEKGISSVATRLRFPHALGWPVESVTLDRGRNSTIAEPGVPPGRVPEDRGSASLVATDAWSRPRLDAPDESLGKELLAVLDRLEPGTSERVVSATLRRHREAWPRFDVGRFRAIAQLRRVLEDRRAAGRRLYLAGDHLVLPTLEGAVASGERAADEALSDLGIPS